MARRGDRSGTTLGPYRLLRSIGSGGMGEVYQAIDTRRDRTVALKLLPEELAHNDEFRTRFLRESFAAARLNDRHVVPIHDFGEIDGELFLDMRLIDGVDLRRRLQRGEVTPAFAVGVVRQIAAALDAAHAAGLVHRDVKPENILVETNGSAYLADFGLVRVAGEDSLTTAGVPVGSINYMAPERFDTEVEAGPAVDIYALACVLYECIGGEKPFGGGSLEFVIAGHLHRELPPTGTAFDEVIAAGTEKVPANRPASATRLAQDAERALAGRTVTEPKESTRGTGTAVTLIPSTSRSREFQGGRRRILSLWSVAALVLAVVLSGGAYGLSRMSDQDSEPSDQGSAPPAAARGAGDLGLGTPISNRRCNGTGALVIHQNVIGENPREVQAALEAYPGSSYLRADQFIINDGAGAGPCGSLRPDLDGAAIYVVYSYFNKVRDACAAIDPNTDAYVRVLNNQDEVGDDPC